MSLNTVSSDFQSYGKLATSVILPLLIVICAIVIWDKFAIRSFFCLIEGDIRVFEVQIPANKTIAHLKKIIHKECIERPIHAKHLTLLKVTTITQSLA
jgi:hypothetical protein